MTSNTEIRVLFLLQRAESWSNLRQIWRVMSTDSGFRPDLWVLPYHAMRPSENSDRCAEATALLTNESVAHEVWTKGDDFDVGRYDVVVFNAPYDLERPSSLHFDVVARRVAVTAYIPYGIVVGGGRKNLLLQYAQPTQMYATLTFARSWREKEMYRRHCPTGDSHVQVTGLPRLDDTTQLGADAIDPELIQAVGGRFAVLWNSHFSVGRRHRDSFNYSTFDRIGSELLEYAAGRNDLALIWRPHPHLLPTLIEEGVLRPEEVGDLEAELRRAGIILDRRSDHRHAFAVSSALITDAGSFLLEYLMTEKPMAYLCNPEGPGLTSEAEELVDRLVTAVDTNGVLSFIERARRESAVRLSEHSALKKEFLPMQDGRAAERIVESIRASVHSRRNTTLAHSALGDSYPILTRLTMRLRESDAAHRAVPKWRRSARRYVGRLREEIVEGIKRRPALYRSFSRWRP